MNRDVIVYYFGEGDPENKAAKDYLGGKGWGLGFMTNLGLPVPKGFTIPTTMCQLYMENGNEWPKGLMEEVNRNLDRLQKEMGKELGNPDDPLLLSVRSGAAISMPGMMDTVLNLGLNDITVEALAKKTGNVRFAYDSYRRLMQMFGNVVMKIDRKHFEEAIIQLKAETKKVHDLDLTADDLKELCKRFRAIYVEVAKTEFPQDVRKQLDLGISAVFDSWNNKEAIAYRRINRLTGIIGSAVNVQAMVFGNMGDTSGTGVGFTRDPATGENLPFGEFLQNAQGEDVVAGIRTPIKIAEMEALGGIWPRIHDELLKMMVILNNQYRDMVDLEFTIEEGKLWLLQSRTGKRTGQAMIRIACDLIDEGIITEQEAIIRMEPSKLNECLFERFDDKQRPTPIAHGLGASPGAAVGPIVFLPEDAIANKDRKPILVRRETSPEDIDGMNVASGILTSFGGATSHAAVVARGMGKCCVCGCSNMYINEKNKTVSIGGKEFKEFDVISIDGKTGDIFEGVVPRVPPKLDGYFDRIMKLADKYRLLGVRCNADTPKDASLARSFGAEGIGLTRTEHMFFDSERIFTIRQMILSETLEERASAIERLLPFQRNDFIGLFRAMDGLPVTIRLLDPPLHEFLPKEEALIVELAKATGKPVDKVKALCHSLEESNPMLGFRGVRLGVVNPEITEMQARAIIEAAVHVAREGGKVFPEIMIPLIFSENEFKKLRDVIKKVADKIISEADLPEPIHYSVGTMLELPRACIRSGVIAQDAEFYSFGTNDLTQTTFGLSRDDSSKFMESYVTNDILKVDPFETLDQDGVGWLMTKAVTDGRATRPNMKCGICGEQTDPDSIQFLHDLGLTYISCSPYRVPVARVSCARAALLSAVRK